MRVTSEHVEAMRELIAPLDTERVREAYRKGEFRNSHLTKDLNRRYRWDLLWAAKAYGVVQDAGYNDSHIDTALRAIVPAL
jgi:hypothetical protein